MERLNNSVVKNSKCANCREKLHRRSKRDMRVFCLSIGFFFFQLVPIPSSQNVPPSTGRHMDKSKIPSSVPFKHIFNKLGFYALP